MTRKHFEILAKQIAMIDDLTARNEAYLAVARAGWRLNPRFNAAKFKEACGL